MLTVRPAATGDAEAIAAIYNEGIEDRVATFETRLRTPAEIAEFLAGPLPCLVAVEEGVVLGFARVTPYSDRCVYDGVGEHGVYVARAARGRGVGSLLLRALCAVPPRSCASHEWIIPAGMIRGNPLPWLRPAHTGLTRHLSGQ